MVKYKIERIINALLAPSLAVSKRVSVYSDHSSAGTIAMRCSVTKWQPFFTHSPLRLHIQLTAISTWYRTSLSLSLLAINTLKRLARHKRRNTAPKNAESETKYLPRITLVAKKQSLSERNEPSTSFQLNRLARQRSEPHLQNLAKDWKRRDPIQNYITLHMSLLTVMHMRH